MWDVLFFELFHTSSLPLSLSFFFKHNSPLSSHPVWQPFQNGKLQVSFPCQVLQPAMLSILLSYLKNVEYQQWLSLVHCQLLYEAILAEWDGSQSRESSAAVCTTTPVTARLFRSLYSSAALGAAMVVVLPSEWPRFEALGCGCRCYLSVHGPPAPRPASWQPAVEGVSSWGNGKAAAPLGPVRALVSALNFVARVGGG